MAAGVAAVGYADRCAEFVEIISTVGVVVEHMFW